MDIFIYLLLFLQNVAGNFHGNEVHLRSDFIVSYLTQHKWNVTLDSFESDTVIGRKAFTNIIATIGSPREKNLILACHYESKLMDKFYGSCDSAMPCAMILLIASTIGPKLVREESPYGLQLIFFDGEEAFVSWSSKDSLYGSRHLAEEWSKVRPEGEMALSKIKLFVLLDLLGTKQSAIPNYGLAGDEYYETLVALEQKMRQNSLLSATSDEQQPYFKQSHRQHMVMDDHIPFYTRGVPILHLIPTPFPKYWHTPGDNVSSIDWDVSYDMMGLVNLFVNHFMHPRPVDVEMVQVNGA